ncbi:MAG: TonB-dependent receptor [Bacteroidales bacterium]|nr:TonB-dependent receptor [Bacteroidales bacterium]
MRKISITLFAVLALSFCAFAQDEISVRMVSADSLVSVIRNLSGNRIHIAGAEKDDSFYSLDATPEVFVEKALAKLREGGYTISEYNGILFVVKGRSMTPAISSSWFLAESRQETTYHEEETQAAVYQNKTYEIGQERNYKPGRKATIHGYVKDASSGEPVVGISVYDGNTSTYTMTDAYGFWKLYIPSGRNTLNFSGYPMEDVNLDIIVYEEGGLDITMKEKVTTLKAATVSAESVANHRTARLGLEKIQIERIKKIPTAFGEGDILKAVLALPGVQSVGEASSGFNVRGGSVDQNLILFNEGTVYNPNHLFGLFSAFNSDVISHAELYKSSIPAEFGGRISSVLDIHAREGNKNKVQGSLGIGLLTSRAEIDGPLGEKTSFVLGGRTTYSNWIMGLLPDDSHYHDGKTQFMDLNAGISHRFNETNTLYLNGYWSHDKFSFSNDTTFSYSNLNLSAKLRSLLSVKTTMEVAAGFDSYTSKVDGHEVLTLDSYKYSNGINQEYLKVKFKHLYDESHTMSFGVNAQYYNLQPGTMKPGDAASMVAERILDKISAVEAAAYFGDSWTFSEKWAFEGGVRLGAYKSTDGGTLRVMPEIRLSAKYSLLSNLSVKMGINTLRQNIHMISNTSTISPMDAWTLANKNIKPQDGYQAAGGLYWTSDQGVDISVEGYWKQSRNNLDYRSGAQLIMNPELDNDLIRTRSRSFGAELMVRKASGKLNGWASYTYSRAFMQQMENTGTGLINGGRWYKAPHDKPHNFKLAGNYKFTHRYSLSANIDYSTGRPITVPVAIFSSGGRRYLAFSDRNEYRIPDYFRLDLAMNIEPSHYLKNLMHLSFTVGVYNVTGRKNAYSVYYSMKETYYPQGYKISVFACPIPYINLNIKF